MGSPAAALRRLFSLAAVSGWEVAGLEVGATLLLRLTQPLPGGGEDWIELTLGMGEPSGRVLRRTRRGWMRYQGALDRSDAARLEARRGSLGGVFLALAKWLDEEERPLEQRLAPPAPAGPLDFDREGLLALLSGLAAPDEPLVAGWRLLDVFPAGDSRRGASESLLIECGRPRARSLLITVAPRPGQGLRQTAHLVIGYQADGPLAPGQRSVLTLVATWLAGVDREGLALDFPALPRRVRERLTAARSRLPVLAPATLPTQRPRALNLAAPGDCGQACVFCSVRSRVRTEARAEDFPRLAAEMRAARERGIDELRINGVDPLAWERVDDLLGLADELGFPVVEVYSPCRQLACRDRASRWLTRCPAAVFIVPLHGVDADTHEAVTRTPGAFAEVERAIEVVLELAGAARLRTTTVAVRQNLHQLAAIARYAEQRGIAWEIHGAYPMSESERDPWRGSYARYEELAQVAAESWLNRPEEGLVIGGQLPCVLFRAMRERGVPLSRWLDLSGTSARQQGAVYRSARIEQARGGGGYAARTVGCPLAEGCVLAQACPAELLLSYVDAEGMEEIQPVTLEDLLLAQLESG